MERAPQAGPEPGPQITRSIASRVSASANRPFSCCFRVEKSLGQPIHTFFIAEPHDHRNMLLLSHPRSDRGSASRWISAASVTSSSFINSLISGSCRSSRASIPQPPFRFGIASRSLAASRCGEPAPDALPIGRLVRHHSGSQPCPMADQPANFSCPDKSIGRETAAQDVLRLVSVECSFCAAGPATIRANQFGSRAELRDSALPLSVEAAHSENGLRGF